MLYTHLQHHNDTIIRQTQKDFFNKYLPLTLFVRFERIFQGLNVRGSWRPNINCNILTPHSYGRHVVSFLFFWCSTGALGSTLLGAGFLYYILSASSLDPNSRASRGPLRPGVVFPNTSRLQLAAPCSSNSTELYNRSTPTRSLKSNV